jgi:hypothetical protein
MATYSLGLTGVRSDQFGTQNKLVLIDDAEARQSQQQGAMAVGTPILCKNPDGSQSWYTIDAERWSPALTVLKPLV